MAFDRVADNGKGANEILAVESACVDCSAQTGGHRQTTLAHRARLRRIEAGTGPGTLRGPELARVSSSCNASSICHRLRVDPMTAGQPSQALLTMLYRSTDSL